MTNDKQNQVKENKLLLEDSHDKRINQPEEKNFASGCFFALFFLLGIFIAKLL